MNPSSVTIIGGGIVGLATARALVQQGIRRVVVLEAEDELAAHQTGHNSGVIHSGLYYKPGSAKAKNCAEGREAMYRFCEERGVPHERCGKVVVAVREDQRPALEELERRGRANGLEGVRRLPVEALREHEPHCAGMEGLYVPQTGIVDFSKVAQCFADDIRSGGGEIRCGFRVTDIHRDGAGFILQGPAGEARAERLVNCAGLHSDRIAHLCGLAPEVQIIPFRGEYYKIRSEKEHLVKHLIYPVPDARLPFLGVHFTRMIQGGIEAGPNAVLAFKREGYKFRHASLRDLHEMLTFPGFWKMSRTWWKVGLHEMRRSLSKEAFVAALQELIPEIEAKDVQRYHAGVRAQAVDADGRLVQDFRILKAERMVHVLNAPSPAATSSIAIGQTIASYVQGVN